MVAAGISFFLVLIYVGIKDAKTNTKIMISMDGLKTMSSSTLPLTDLSNKFISKSFGILLILTAALSFFSCALGAVCAGARVLFPMSRDGLMFKSMKKVHNKSQTPYIGSRK